PAGATRTMASSSRREAATTIAAGLASSARPVPAARPPVALLAVAALVAVLSFGLGFATGQWRARSQLSDPAAALGHLADSASIARTHEPLPDSAAGPRPETPVAQAQGPAGLERLVGEVRHELDFERVDRALAVHYPVLGRKGPAVQSMRAFWEAAGGTSLAARVGALVPRVRRGLTDPETTVSERARLYSVFEPLARLDAVLDFYGATTLLGWNELTAGMASTEPCADEPEHSGWQPVQTWPEMEQVLACSNMRVVEGERDFWNMVLGLAWLRREPTRLLEFGYRSPSWWERQPVELLTRATFVAGEAILQISFTALPTSSVSRSTAATGAPELEVLVRPSHRRFTDVGGSGTTREELRADATGCLTRIAPGILGGDRSYWIRVRILAGPTPTYRHKMLLLGLWTRPPRSASAGGSSGGKSAPAPGRGSN
ncbi:MAG: hypothetical protein HY814_12580, partial [Candidatus Riflebacteria bacterium]|nr:hypothetical protein [Candidatus Riflebacteria bacterium]